jgi:hypothetical protein
MDVHNIFDTMSAMCKLSGVYLKLKLNSAYLYTITSMILELQRMC